MFDNAQMLDRLERALDATPTCPVCGAPTDIRHRDGQLWLECSATPVDPPSGFLARLEAALAPHPRRLVADLMDPIAA
jgi:hypothetical protein